MKWYLEIVKAIIFGVIQGITEWLPVSSTGHMLLADEFLQLQFSQEFVNSFFVLIQLGSIMAIVVIYFKDLWPFDFKHTTKDDRKKTWLLWAKIIVACIPAGVLGVLFDDVVDQIFYNPITIAITLILYGIGFLIVESLHIDEEIHTRDNIDFITAFNIGLFQCLALIPGTSRSGSTILGSRMIGVNRTAAAEFSFFVAIPVMAGASLLKIIKMNFALSLLEWAVMAVGAIVAFVVSLVVVKLMMNFIKKHSFKCFGIYRILLGIAIILYFYILK